jgi:nucleoside-diphosphate-sugar epimerase
MHTVLVTGAAGFAGSHLLDYLVRSGGTGPLAAWARSAPPDALTPLAQWEQVDLLDRARVDAAVAALRPATARRGTTARRHSRSTCGAPGTCCPRSAGTRPEPA